MNINLKRALFALALLVYILYMGAAITRVSAQDDSTPTAEATEIVALPPAPPAESTVEPAQPTPPVIAVNNTVPADNGFDSGMVKFILIAVGLVLAALVIIILDQNRTARASIIQLGASAPAFGYQGVKTGIESGMGELATLAKTTTFTTLDDEGVEKLKAVFMGWFKDIDAARAEANNAQIEKAIQEALRKVVQ